MSLYYIALPAARPDGGVVAPTCRAVGSQRRAVRQRVRRAAWPHQVAGYLEAGGFDLTWQPGQWLRTASAIISGF